MQMKTDFIHTSKISALIYDTHYDLTFDLYLSAFIFCIKTYFTSMTCTIVHGLLLLHSYGHTTVSL